MENKQLKRKKNITKNISILQKTIYFFCFLAILLAMGVIVFDVIDVSYTNSVLYSVVAIDFVILILNKIYTYLVEIAILDSTIDKKLKENSFIVNDSFFASVSDEFNHFCLILFFLLSFALIGYGFAFGYLSRMIALCLILTVLIIRSKKAICFFVAGKILDSPTDKNYYNVFRGYAKLFFSEYTHTRFRRRDDYYRKKLYNFYNPRKETHDKAINSILYFEAKYQLKHERNKLIVIIVCIIIVFLLTFYTKTEDYIKYMLNYVNLNSINEYPIKMILIFVMNTILCLVSATTLFHYKYTCTYIKQIIHSISHGSPDQRYEQFSKINKKKNDYKQIRTLGLLTVCTDQGYVVSPAIIEDIASRPLFRHHLFSSIKEFCLFAVGILISIIMFLSSIVDLNFLIIILCVALCVLLLFHFAVVPTTKRIIIQIWCNRINEKKKKEKANEI